MNPTTSIARAFFETHRIHHHIDPDELGAEIWLCGPDGDWITRMRWERNRGSLIHTASRLPFRVARSMRPAMALLLHRINAQLGAGHTGFDPADGEITYADRACLLLGNEPESAFEDAFGGHYATVCRIHAPLNLAACGRIDPDEAIRRILDPAAADETRAGEELPPPSIPVNRN